MGIYGTIYWLGVLIGPSYLLEELHQEMIICWLWDYGVLFTLQGLRLLGCLFYGILNGVNDLMDLNIWN